MLCKTNFSLKCLIFFILMVSLRLEAGDKDISYECKGISNFQIVGSSGEKIEMVTRAYEFKNGVLQDLNNIECDWKNSSILCESTFLNMRKLQINQKTKEISDFISGNKGFGQYIDNFSGKCILIK